MRKKTLCWYWKIQAICRIIACSKFLTVTGDGLFSINVGITIGDAREIALHLKKLADNTEIGNKAVDQVNKILGAK